MKPADRPEPPEGRKPMNERHARFAQLVASGELPTDAYQRVFGTERRLCASNSATRLLARLDVKEYIARLRREAESETVLTIAEKRTYLARAIRTPISDIGEESDLAQEISETVSEHGTRRRVRAVDRLRALALDSQLAGHDQPKRIEIGITLDDIIRISAPDGKKPGFIDGEWTLDDEEPAAIEDGKPDPAA